MTITRADALAAVMDAYDAPFGYGAADCCTAACAAFARLHGIDPMEPMRGGYTSGRGATRLIGRQGGWAAMTARLAQAAGLRECDPVPGALVLTRLHDGRQALGLALAPAQIAVKTKTGFETVAEHDVAWWPTCRR